MLHRWNQCPAQFLCSQDASSASGGNRDFKRAVSPSAMQFTARLCIRLLLIKIRNHTGFKSVSLPDYQACFLPLLKCISDGAEYTMRSVIPDVSDALQLTVEERNQRLPSNRTYISNRLAWAKVYLTKAGLIRMVRRGVFVITERGVSVLAENPQALSNEDLNRFPEFVEFLQQRGGRRSNAGMDTTEEVTSSQTPEEQLEFAYRTINDALASELLEQVCAGTPAFFEQLVVDLMLSMGYGGPDGESGHVTQYGRDEGIDGIINEDRLGLDVVYLQAKRWQGTVGRPEIQKFVGALHGKRAKKGVFITTSSFSEDAKNYVQTIDPRVILIDGKRLSDLMITYDVGVSTSRSYSVKKIDSDYFESV